MSSQTEGYSPTKSTLSNFTNENNNKWQIVHIAGPSDHIVDDLLVVLVWILVLQITAQRVVKNACFD